MNCIDAIEGTVKSILSRICQTALDAAADDSEYIQTVRTILEATEQFARSNREIVPHPEILKEVLYEYSRKLWLQQRRNSSSTNDQGKAATGSDVCQDYQIYYYDYIFHNDQYPL